MISLRQLIATILFACGISLLAWCKISVFVGSPAAAFSIAHCLTPLIGLMAGGMGAFLLFLLRTAIRCWWHVGFSNVVLSCHLSTLSAGLYLGALNNNQYTISLRKKLLLALVPISCIALFCMHSVGSQAWAYSLFWLIPIAALTLPHKSLLFHMLGSTFIAHAVGSVRWLYCMPEITADAWLALIPIVMIERLLFASGMYLVYYGLTRIPAFSFNGISYTPTAQKR